jgi:hypothetical protein
MPIARNDQGDTVFLDNDGAWKPATLAEHPETKQRLAFDGSAWTPLPPRTSTAEAIGRGITQGASFGFRDEGQGLIEAGGGGGRDDDALTNLGYLARGAYRKLIGDPEAEARYKAAVERERASTKQIEQERPGAYLGGNVLGAVAMPVGFAARAPTFASRVAAGAKTGALAGGLTGFGEGEGLGGSLKGAAIGAPVGGLVGGASVPVVEGLARGAGALASYPVSVARGLITPERASERAIGRALQQAERADPGAVNRFTEAQFAAQGPGGPAVVGDVLGEPGRKLARSAANISPEARETMNIALNARGEQQGARAINWLDSMFSFPNARTQQEALDATRRSATNQAYQAAERQGAGGLWSPELERLASSQGVATAMKTAVQTSQDEAVRRGMGGFNPKISFTPDGRIQFNRGPTGVPTYPDLRYWDQVRRELSDAAQKAGRGTEENMRIGGLAAALNAELDRLVPAYQVARRTAAGFFNARDALEAGQNFATQRFGANEARAALQQMNATERALFRDGYISRMKDVLAATKDNRDITKMLAASTEDRDKMAIALGPQRAREFQAMLHAESIMQKLKEAVQGNSTTVMQLLGAGAAGAAGGGYLGFDPTTSGIGSALTAGLKKGADANMARHITRLMMSRDPAVLQAGIRQIARNARNLEILQRVSNAVARAAAETATERLPRMQYGGRPIGPTIVGEDGPEVFVPDRPGTVIPANGPMPSREEIQRYLAATTQDYPKFGPGGIPINPAGVDAMLARAPASQNIEDRRDELGGFAAAAQRTARGVRPPGGRTEGAGTQFVEGGYGIPAAYRSLDEGARQALESAGSLQRGGSYDPGPVLQQAIGAVGAPLVAPAMEGAVLGAGAIRRAAIPQTSKQALREGAPYPQYAEQYPPTAPPALKKDPKTGKEFLGKVASPEAEQFMKSREAISEEMKQGYEPYYDPAKRFLVDPSKYPGRNVDTLTIQPARQKTIDQYLKEIDAPITRERLRAAFERGKELGNANDWYFMGQLEKDFVNELGAKEGRKAFLNRFASGMAATTSGNNPTTNLLMSHYLNYLEQRGLPMPTAGHQLPSPVGGRYGMSNVEDYMRMREAGGYAGFGADQPKMHNFARSFIGDLDRAVMDDQMAKGMVGHAADPNFADRARKQAFGLLEAPLHAEAAAAGVRPGAYQDVAWAGFKNEPGKPMISHINDAIERTHRLTGMPRDEIVRRGLIRNEIPLYGFSAPIPSMGGATAE